jgi:hypothetical protein
LLDPLIGLTEYEGGPFAGEDFGAEVLAEDGLAAGLGHEEGLGAHFGDDFELGDGSIPLAKDDEELEEEDAEVEIGGCLAHIVFECGEGLVELTELEEFGG